MTEAERKERRRQQQLKRRHTGHMQKQLEEKERQRQYAIPLLKTGDVVQTMLGPRRITRSTWGKKGSIWLEVPGTNDSIGPFPAKDYIQKVIHHAEG